MTRTPSRNSEAPPPYGGLEPTACPIEPSLQIGVFAKHWTPGATKTRLAAAIGHERAAAASRLFLETTLQRITTATTPRYRNRVAYRLAHAPADYGARFAELDGVSAGPWRAEPQATGSLGARMRAFFARCTDQSTATLLVGSDTPHLPTNALAAAAEALLEPGPRRVVFGPTEDGGYWLIGCRGELPPAFGDDLPWSAPSLLTETLSRLRAAGWREDQDYHLVDGWYDIDDAVDLSRLRAALASKAAEEDPALDRLKARLDELLPSPACDSP